MTEKACEVLLKGKVDLSNVGRSQVETSAPWRDTIFLHNHLFSIQGPKCYHLCIFPVSSKTATVTAQVLIHNRGNCREFAAQNDRGGSELKLLGMVKWRQERHVGFK